MIIPVGEYFIHRNGRKTSTTVDWGVTLVFRVDREVVFTYLYAHFPSAVLVVIVTWATWLMLAKA